MARMALLPSEGGRTTMKSTATGGGGNGCRCPASSWWEALVQVEHTGQSVLLHGGPLKPLPQGGSESTKLLGGRRIERHVLIVRRAGGQGQGQIICSQDLYQNPAVTIWPPEPMPQSPRTPHRMLGGSFQA